MIDSQRSSVPMADLAQDYLAVWSETDPDLRRKAIEACWSSDGVQFVEGAQFRGHDQLAARITEAHQQFVATGTFTVGWADDLAVHGDVGTFTIRLLTREGAIAWDARVILVRAQDGRIAEDYQLTVTPISG